MGGQYPGDKRQGDVQMPFREKGKTPIKGIPYQVVAAQDRGIAEYRGFVIKVSQFLPIRKPATLVSRCKCTMNI